MNYLAITNGTGTVAWRVWPIFRELEAAGHDTHIIHAKAVGDDQYNAIMKWADVVIFQMVANAKVIRDMKAKGIYTVFDCDDYIAKVPERHPSFKETNGAAYQRMFRETAREVDMVTVTTEPLRKHFLKYNDNVVILENYIPVEFWEKPYSPNTSKKLRFGWAGSIGRPDDLEVIAPVVKQIVKEIPTSKFCYIGGGGWDNQRANRWVFGQDNFKEIPYESKEYHPGSKVEVWPETLNSLRLDVALAPVADNVFSRHKSQIKYYEYSINRWPGVYQEYLYKGVVKHGVTGFLATTQDEWYKYVKLLLEDGKLRKQLGDAAYNDVQSNYAFSSNRDKWLNVYRQAGERSRTAADGFHVK